MIIILDEKRVMYEKQFLKDISLQNYTKYNIDVSDWLPEVSYSLKGRMFVVNRRFSDDMLKTATAVLGYWHRFGAQSENQIKGRVIKPII